MNVFDAPLYAWKGVGGRELRRVSVWARHADRLLGRPCLSRAWRAGRAIRLGLSALGRAAHRAINDERRLPLAIAGVRDLRQVVAGERHACCLAADRSVWCWGQNEAAQLGDPAAVKTATPARVMGLSDVERLTSGAAANHLCAERGDGKVFRWGSSTAGQLGGSTLCAPLAL